MFVSSLAFFFFSTKSISTETVIGSVSIANLVTLLLDLASFINLSARKLINICIAIDEGSNRFADILAFKKEKGSTVAFILDPTIRFENNIQNQARLVDEEKKNIYEKCIPFFNEKYRHRFGNNCIFTVQGLLFGARGTIFKLVAEYFKRLGIHQSHLNSIAQMIISDSVSILHHHLYKNC